MGIMGKTQGVKMEANPKPNARARNAPQPEGCAGASGELAGALASAYHAGMAGAAAAAPGSTFSFAVPVHRPGTHVVALQV